MLRWTPSPRLLASVVCLSHWRTSGPTIRPREKRADVSIQVIIPLHCTALYHAGQQSGLLTTSHAAVTGCLACAVQPLSSPGPDSGRGVNVRARQSLLRMA